MDKFQALIEKIRISKNKLESELVVVKDSLTHEESEKQKCVEEKQRTERELEEIKENLALLKKY